MKPNVFVKIVNKFKQSNRSCNDLIDETQPWYKGELNREQAEELLFSKEIGVFIVRKSESVKNAWVLSVRVPRFINYSTIAHYLIEKSKNGYKLKNCTKYFTSLITLVTHCSMIRDNLPIMLNMDYYKPGEKKNEYVEVFNEFLYYSSGSSIESMNFDQISMSSSGNSL
jgi:hypothetical protein